MLEIRFLEFAGLHSSRNAINKEVSYRRHSTAKCSKRVLQESCWEVGAAGHCGACVGEAVHCISMTMWHTRSRGRKFSSWTLSPVSYTIPMLAKEGRMVKSIVKAE